MPPDHRFALCTRCRLNTPPMGSTVCRACMEAEDDHARAEGLWDQFFAAVEEAADRMGETGLSEAARNMRHARSLVTQEKKD